MRIYIHNTMCDAVDNFDAIFPIERGVNFYGPPRDASVMRAMKQLFDIGSMSGKTVFVMGADHFLDRGEAIRNSPLTLGNELLKSAKEGEQAIREFNESYIKVTELEESLIDHKKSSKKRRRKKPR